MPIVKFKYVGKPEALEKYLAKDRDSQTITTQSEGMSESMAKSIRDEHARFPRTVKNLAFEITQAWPAVESDLHDPGKYNEMGRQLAERLAPGHMAWVVTHTDKDHIHNHIVVSTVNSDTGKLYENKRANFNRMHELNNEIARENGFALIEARVTQREVNLPQEAKAMVSRGKNSWMFDLYQKADFARAFSTSFDEFVGLLHDMNVRVRVEDKNISYTYGTENKAVRGKTLGTRYNKSGLMKAFEENDAKFANDSELKSRIYGDIRAAFDGKGNSLGAPSNLLLESTSHPRLGKKDYGQYTKMDRRRSYNELPSIFNEHGGILHPAMKEALKVSILDYCKDNKIALVQNSKGQTVVRNREHIMVEAHACKNLKNGAEGTIIDFVKNHNETTPLRAISKLTNNPNLLLLEGIAGEYGKGYQSFYLPKPKAAAPHEARKTLQKLLSSRGVDGNAAESFHKNRNVFVGENMSVWFLSERKDSALEFKQSSGGEWQSKQHGNPRGSFSEQLGRSNKMIIFRDPFEFAIASAKGGGASFGGASTVVLFSAEANKRVDELLALHPHHKEVSIFSVAEGQGDKSVGLNVDQMSAKLAPFDIRIKPMSLSGIGRGRGKGPDISM